jgi:tetratricopeptide (TPR) repeat protein
MLKKSLPIITAAVLLGGSLSVLMPMLQAQEADQSVSKPGPQAKTKEEFADYTAANSVTGGATAEKAAHHFEQKHPQSELRVYLYSKVLHEYLTENNSGKVLEMGQKVLTLDASNAIALVLTATALADGMNEGDKDRDKKSEMIRDYCARAQLVLAGGYSPPGATPEQVSAYLGMMQSMNHSALGILELKLGHDTEAEKELRTASEVRNAQPDPYVWYHLALALDHQKKYPEALTAVNSALKFVGPNADLEKLALGERDRLSKLAGPAAATAPAKVPNQDL